MKHYLTSFSYIILFNFFLLGHSFAGEWEVPVVMDGATPITAEELSELIKELDNLVIIDSRLNGTNDKKAIAGSHSLPHTRTSPDSLSNLVPDKLTPVVFYCDGLNCPHSMKAVKKAVSYGYVNIFWFRGGLSEWTDKGFPTNQN